MSAPQAAHVSAAPPPIFADLESAARERGFYTPSDCTPLDRDLRDALLTLENEEFAASEYNKSLTRVFVAALAWITFGAGVWLILAVVS